MSINFNPSSYQQITTEQEKINREIENVNQAIAHLNECIKGQSQASIEAFEKASGQNDALKKRLRELDSRTNNLIIITSVATAISLTATVYSWLNGKFN